jgi:hypothetical protein
VIRYTLSCQEGHGFESWFRDSAAFDTQRQKGIVTCPVCGTSAVDRAIMAPQVARRDRGPAAEDAHASAPAPMALAAPQDRELRAKLKALREALTKDSADVGERFADEARRMHLGESEHRSIHGKASAEDARSLVEEGIEIFPLPVLPDERN